MPDKEIIRIMEEYDLDKDDAEKLQEISEDLGIDEDDAIELLEEF